MKNRIALLVFCASTSTMASASTALDFGPLKSLIGTWKTVDSGGVDVAPGQENSIVGKGGAAVESFYEIITFKPVADATNASDQYLTAIYYEQEVFRKRDNGKFHDQRGYLLYDKKNQLVYNSYCIPRGVCIVTEGKAGSRINFTAINSGIAQSKFMLDNALTTGFTMVMDFTEKDTLRYSQTTNLDIYGKPFSHSDSSTLKRVQ
ncbi:FABP family protein [Vibrio sp. B172a]|uniref:heme-binding beta-barrel domain-containing protein n=1 Tax=Vibrio sp. B172a TaxID=2835790 RepID=UPI002562CC65|nr:FABP family protein [Vibrio sp. B172a]